MVGGQRSFAAGGWEASPLAEMLPVDLHNENDWLPGTQVRVRAEAGHPLWSIVADEALNEREVFNADDQPADPQAAGSSQDTEQSACP